LWGGPNEDKTYEEITKRPAAGVKGRGVLAAIVDKKIPKRLEKKNDYSGGGKDQNAVTKSSDKFDPQRVKLVGFGQAGSERGAREVVAEREGTSFGRHDKYSDRQEV